MWDLLCDHDWHPDIFSAYWSCMYVSTSGIVLRITGNLISIQSKVGQSMNMILYVDSLGHRKFCPWIDCQVFSSRSIADSRHACIIYEWEEALFRCFASILTRLDCLLLFFLCLRAWCYVLVCLWVISILRCSINRRELLHHHRVWQCLFKRKFQGIESAMQRVLTPNLSLCPC